MLTQKRTYDKAFPKRHHSIMLKETDEFELTSNSCDESVGGTALPSSACSEIERRHKRQIKSGEHILVPHDILQNSNVIAWSVRNNISNTKMNSFVHLMISICGGDVSKINLSSSSAHRYRTSELPHISQQIKDIWNSSPKMVVHWDGNLMASLDYKDTDNRLPVLVSGVNGTSWCASPSKFNHKNTIGMVFDTTSSNTG